MILALIIAFLISVTTIPVVIRVAILKRLVDTPDDNRKVHKRAIPFLGGVSIFLGLILGFTISYGFNIGELEPSTMAYLVAAITIIFFIGLKDDIVGLSPLKKLIAQMVCAFIIVVLADIRIPSMYGIFGITQLPLAVSYALSVFAYIVIVNSINLVDGLDGLAGGVGLIACIFFGLWFYEYGDMALAMVCGAMGGSLLGFLVYNFSPAKIFMGDGGSLTVGTVLAFLALAMLNTPHSSEVGMIMSKISRPVAAMAFLCYPLLDTLRVFTIRAIRGESPFTADKRHIHHHLIAHGATHRKAAIAIYLFSGVIGVIAMYSGLLEPTYSFALTFSLALIVSQLMTKIKLK